MKNPSYSNLWWHSFWKEEVEIHIWKWSTSLSVSQRDGRSKDEIEQKKTDDWWFSIDLKNRFGQSMTKRRCCDFDGLMNRPGDGMGWRDLLKTSSADFWAEKRKPHFSPQRPIRSSSGWRMASTVGPVLSAACDGDVVSIEQVLRALGRSREIVKHNIKKKRA